MEPIMIEFVRIRGFRSLADVELSGIPKAAVLIGANGSGKSNFIRFFEMLSWMVGSRRLAEFVEMQGGADDQLYGGNRRTPRIEAEVRLRIGAGHSSYDYRFMLSHAHPDRFFFNDESFRLSIRKPLTETSWQYLGSGHQEAEIVQVTKPSEFSANDLITAKVIVNLLRSCVVYQFHDTSDSSDSKKK